MPQNDLNAQVGRIIDKTRLVLIQNQALREELDKARAEIESQKAQLLAQEGELERQRLELEYLRVASVVASTPEGRREAAGKILNLVREIDRCIRDLHC